MATNDEWDRPHGVHQKHYFVAEARHKDQLHDLNGSVRRVKTPWQWLNHQLHGGLEVGDLAVILTVVNGGKTTALVNVAWRALRHGLFVVFFTFEDGEVKIKRRLIQAISGMTMEEIGKNPVKARYKKNRFLEKYGGRCEIKDLVTRVSTVRDMESLVQSIQDSAKRKIDLVITDYADRFRPPNRRGEPRHEYREVFELCKAVARKLELVHWTASQSNKTRTGKDIIGIEHVSEAYGKIESADLALGLGQTLQDESLGRMTLYTAKVRDAEKHKKCTLLADFARQRIREPK